MRSVFTTIITADYVALARVQFESLRRFDPEVVLYVFISTDSVAPETSRDLPAGMIAVAMGDLCVSGVGQRIREKYWKEERSVFRWAMKPVVMRYVLEQYREQKVIYIDWDIYFYNDYRFLFRKMEEVSVLITAQWNPMRTKYNLATMVNMYNAGFVGMTSAAIPLLEWWAEECLFKCKVDILNGYFVDQSYFHHFHLHEGVTVEVIKHKGCNVADWSRLTCSRTLVDGEVLIAEKYPVIFVHFSSTTVTSILSGRDPLLRGHLDEYEEQVRKYTGVNSILDISAFRHSAPRTGLKGLRVRIRDKVRLKARIRGFIKGVE